MHTLHALVFLAFAFLQQPQKALSQDANATTTVPPAAGAESAGKTTQPAGNAANGTVGVGANGTPQTAPQGGESNDVPEYASPSVVNITLTFSDNTSPEDPSVQDEIKQMEEEYCASFYANCVEKMVIVHRHTKKNKIEQRCKRRTQGFSLCTSYMKNETTTVTPPPSGDGQPPQPQPIAGTNSPGNLTAPATPTEAPAVVTPNP